MTGRKRRLATKRKKAEKTGDGRRVKRAEIVIDKRAKKLIGSFLLCTVFAVFLKGLFLGYLLTKKTPGEGSLVK